MKSEINVDVEGTECTARLVTFELPVTVGQKCHYCCNRQTREGSSAVLELSLRIEDVSSFLEEWPDEKLRREVQKRLSTLSNSKVVCVGCNSRFYKDLRGELRRRRLLPI